MGIYGDAEIRNLTEVIKSGCFNDFRGGFMDRFRDDFAKTLEAKHAISGATAMVLMHAIPGAIGAGAGDEIIIDPVVQFHAIACLHNNVVPVWADVRPDNFLMDPDSVEKLITSRTKAIWVTHLWGFPAEVDRLREIADRHGIYLLEDCAHALMAKYKGKYLGNWGHIGTFSFNMGKQLPTGEGGMAILNDDDLAFELNRRIIFSESPEVLSSNYRMTEFQAAVGVEQLKKIPDYLKEWREYKKILDDAIADCSWLDRRAELPDSEVAPYNWSCLFRGERAGIDIDSFRAAAWQCGGNFDFGFTQKPGYAYAMFRNPNAYGNKGCPYNCHLYTGKVNWYEGMCPVSEDTIPRLVSTYNLLHDVTKYHERAKTLKESIKLVESGGVAPVKYSEFDLRIVNIVKDYGPIEPMEVIRILDEQGGPHLDEHEMHRTMDYLRGRSPYKLARSGPRQFLYVDLSK